MRTVVAIGLLALASTWSGFPRSPEAPWPPQPAPAIALRGSEHGGSFVEDTPGWPMDLVTLFVTEKNAESAWQSPQQHLEWASKPIHSYVADGTGAYVIIAHPTKKQFEHIVDLPTLDAMEISNAGDSTRFEGLWDRVLTWRIRNGLKPIWGTGADDTHSITDIDRSWIALRLTELSEVSVKRALRAGNFYVSNGPVITGIEVRGATIEVRTAEPAEIRWVRSGQFGFGPARVTREAGENRCVKVETSVTRSSYTLNEADATTDPTESLFIRCMVNAPVTGKVAHTQPFVIRSASAVVSPYAADGKWYKGMTHNHGDYLESEEDRLVEYHLAYAARGHSAAFETQYEYWLMPMASYPAGRTPSIERVEPQRVAQGEGRRVTIRGQDFAKGSKVMLQGREIVGAIRVSDRAIELPVPRSLGAGCYEVTVLNPDGFQHGLQRALIVQPRTAANEGWVHFTPFNSELGARHTYAVVSDLKQGVWVGTNCGLSHFDGNAWSLYREKTKDEGTLRLDNVIYDLAVDSDGTVWNTCLRGVGALHPDGKRERWNWKAAGFPRNQVNQILRTGGATYITMHNQQGLFVLRDGKWTGIPVPADGSPVLHAIVRDSAGIFWFGTSNGILRWDETRGGDGWTHYTTANSGLPDDYVRRLALDGAGALWVATATRSEKPVGGLARFKDGEWKTYDPSNSKLPERRVWSVFADSRGRIWAATSRGVACLRPNGAWRIFDVLNSGLGDDLVTDVAEDRQGNLWFTTRDGVSRLRADVAAR